MSSLPRTEIDDWRACLADLCESGLLTCTTGKPGLPGATYALAWLPLNNPENYSPDVIEQHSRNLKKLGLGNLPTGAANHDEH
jgi:hypothetical protein